MSRQLNLFGKPVVRKAGPYRSPSNRYEKFVNAYVASNPGLPLVEAKRKADDAWRETGNGENAEEVEMMLQQLLTAPAGLCQNDVSAWVAPAIFRFATDSRNQPFL